MSPSGHMIKSHLSMSSAAALLAPLPYMVRPHPHAAHPAPSPRNRQGHCESCRNNQIPQTFLRVLEARRKFLIT